MSDPTTRNLIERVCLLLLFTLLPSPLSVDGGEPPVRERLLMDRGWRFSLGDAASDTGDFGFGRFANFAKAGEGSGPQDPAFTDSAWRSLDLPHDWAVELDFVNVPNDAVKEHGYKPVGRMFPRTSVGWYRKGFVLPASDEGRRISLVFDGAFRESIVWLNGHYLGRNTTGYGGWTHDVTDYLNYGGRNVVVVRVDATQYEGWFYEGAGIYRHVWLEKNGPLHVARGGTYVTTTTAPGEKTAAVHVATTLRNETAGPLRASVQISLLSTDGRVRGSRNSGKVRIRGEGGEATVSLEIPVTRPLLWSPATPNLYRLVTRVFRESELADSTSTIVGIRTIRFDPDSGLFVNGTPTKILGVCNHQDHAGVGAALPDRIQEFRIRRLKEMGCNALRTSHNPPTPELLDVCDRLGMLVLDENRLMGSTAEMGEQFARLILRDRNHPSVFLWSLGNEEWVIQNGAVGGRIAKSLLRVQRSLDPSRMSTYAANNGPRFEGINSVIDIRGINYLRLGDFDAYRRDHPTQIIIGTEEASTLCTRGITAVDTVRGYMSDYDVGAPGWGMTAERWWTWAADRPWYAGAFVWTGFDYRGEPTPYRWPCISSHFGIMDVCGFPKNNFYYYQSWWTDRDVLHLSPHWTHGVPRGTPVDVWCQSNCDSVELFLNGSSLGMKTMPRNSHLEWRVPYEPGALEARGMRKGRAVTTRCETAGRGEAVTVLPDRGVIDGDGEDCAVVTVSMRDARGVELPAADHLIHFSLSGPGEIIGVGNGDPSSHERDRALDGRWRRRLFSGKCQVIIRSTGAGEIRLTAAADSCAAGEASIVASQVTRRPRVE